jgi:cyclase
MVLEGSVYWRPIAGPARVRDEHVGRGHVSNSRRQFLQALGSMSVVLAGLATGRPGAVWAADSLSVDELRGGLSLVTGAGGNVVVLRRPEGAIVVDSGAPSHAEALGALLRERLDGVPVRALLNTHWHLDHTGGNDVLAPMAEQVIAHENTRLWMSTAFYVDWEKRRYERRDPAARPNATFFSSDPQPREIEVGGTKAVYAHLPEAHTDGDIYVQFPEANVIVAGGAVTARKYPVLDYITGGWIGGLIDATRKLIDLSDSDTLIVPDSGPPQRLDDLHAQVEMLSTVRERIEEIALQGRGVRDMIEEGITRDFDTRFDGDVALFISNAYEGMWWNRLRGIVA